MWVGMAVPEVVFELDALYSVLTALTLAHAVSKRGFLRGTALVVIIFVQAAVFEHLSLWLGGTHCHAASPLMITPCSSLNSVLFYIPFSYVPVAAATRLNLHPLALPFLCGLLQLGFGSTYEIQGPINNFWHWPTADGVIASAPSLAAWHHYPPVLVEARATGEVTGVSAEGVWTVSRHAGMALADRWHHFPVFAPWFHFAFGFGWMSGLMVTGPITENIPLWRFVVAGLLCTLFFLIPIEVVRVLLMQTVNPYLAIPIASLLALVPVLVAPRGSNVATTSSDPLLFAIPLVMHLFFLTLPFRTAVTMPNDLTTIIVTITALSLAAHFRCCFLVGSAGGEVAGSGSSKKKKRENSKKRD